MVHPFQNFQRLLWLVLGTLARRGYPVQPADARDLVQDFYLEEWSSLEERFDPAQGRFESYLFKAFYRFARQRIVRMERWRNRLLDLDHAIELSDEAPTPEDVLDDEARAARMTQAMRRLPESSRGLLRDLLVEAAGNQRELARQRGITRYRLREQLTDAVGQLAVEMGTLSPAADMDEKIALALWGDGRDAREVATALHVAVPDVHAARRRNVHQLLSALHATSNRKAARRTTMNTRESAVSSHEPPLMLLKRALVSKRDTALLQQVRERADEIVAVLDEEDEDYSDSEQAAIQKDPEWVGQVFHVLGVGQEEEAAGEAEAELERAIAELRSAEDYEIGAAFSALIEGLPPALVAWDELFRDVPQIPVQAYETLRESPSVREAGRCAYGLLRFGITPATVFEATVGVSLFLDQLAKSAREPRLELLFRAPQQATEAPMYSRLLAQVRATPTCPPDAAAALLHWIGLVASERPYLFEGYRVIEGTNEALQLVADRTYADSDLLRHWTAGARHWSLGRLLAASVMASR